MSERAAYWRQLVGDWEASGLSQAEFCRRRKLSAVTFAWWKRRLRSGGSAGPRLMGGRTSSPSTGRAAFVELTLPTRGGGYELALPGGLCLHLPADFDPERIARLVRAVVPAC